MAVFREIEIDFDVWKEIVARMTSFDEQPNEVLRRILQLDKASSGDSQISNGSSRTKYSPLSFRDAAIEVLKQIEEPMHYKNITKVALENKFLSTTGLTPELTMSATLSTNSKGNDSAFIPRGRGHYSLRGDSGGVHTLRFGRSFGFELKGKEHSVDSARDVLIGVFEVVNTLDESIVARFASLPKHGRRRRFVAMTKDDLYPGRLDLCEKHSHQLSNGYWVGTNYSRTQIRQILQMVCETADLEWNKDLKVYLGT